MSMMIKIRSCLQRLILRNFCFKLYVIVVKFYIFAIASKQLN